MVAAFAREGGYGAPASVIHFDSAHPQHAIVIPDAQLLFTGDFHRAGPDLVIIGQDGRHHIIPDYFASEQRPALAAPNGASLPPDVIDLLAGSPTPNQYAQAGAPAASADPIGTVEKVVGNATVVRNGVAVALHVGDKVYQSDVVQTGSDSQVGIGFPDGTALNLVADTRMALNEYSYDPNSNSNSALISLVEGTFSFVAGKVAHTGDMKIQTPVATMGIRGTTGWVQELATITANYNNNTYSFAVSPDYGTNQTGMYDLIDQSGNVIATVSQSGFLTMVTPQGVGLSPVVTTQPMTPAQLQFDQQIVQEAFQTLNLINNPNPHSNPGSGGSGGQNQQNGPAQQLLKENGGTININTPGENNSTSGGSQAGSGNGQNQPTPTAYWISGDGNWSNPLDWSDSWAPLNWQVLFINISGATVTIDSTAADSGPSPTEAASLLIGLDGALQIIGGGSLTVAGTLDVFGTVDVDSNTQDPTFTAQGPVTVETLGTIEAVGSAATIHFSDPTGATVTDVNGNSTIYTIDNSGTILAGQSGQVFFEQAVTKNEATGHILAQSGGIITVDQGSLDNAGSVVADAATIKFEQVTVTNESGAFITSQDGATLTFDQGSLDNFGTVSAGTVSVGGGELKFEQTTLTNEFDAVLQAANGGTLFIDAGGGTISNIGTLAGQDGGTVALENVTIDNTGTLELNSAGAATTLKVGTVTLDGDGAVTLSDSSTNYIVSDGAAGLLTNVDNTISGAGNIGHGDASFVLVNDPAGIIDATGTNALIIDNHSPAINNFALNEIVNSGTIEATGSGGLTIENSTIDNSTFDPNTNTGVDGRIEALSGSHIDLAGATILQGFVSVAAGGEIDTVGGTSNEIETANGPTHNTAVPTITIAAGGILAVSDNSSLTLASPDAIDNAGTIELNAAGHATTLNIDQGFAGINGGGSITLSNDADNLIAVTQSGDQLTNFDNTISGAGTIGSGGMVLVNDATIDANDSNPLTLDPASLTNSGLLEATSGGTLILSNTTVTNTSGTIAGSGTSSTVELSSATMTGGPVTIGTGAVLTALNTDSITGGSLTNSGTVSVAGTVSIGNDTITNNAATGAIVVGDGTHSDTLTLTSTTVSNAGSITVDDNALLLLNGSDTVTGAGAITVDNGGLLNLGGTDTISGGGTLTVESGGAVAVLSGAGVTFDNVGVVDDATNLAVPGIDVASGAVLTLQDGTSISGGGTGTLGVEVGAQLLIATPSGATLDGLIVDDDGAGSGTGAGGAGIYVSGAVLTLDGGTQIEGGPSAAGTLQIDSAGELKITGAATLDSVSVTDGNLGAVIPGIDVSGAVLTLDDDTVISGGTLTVEGASGSQLLITAGPGSASDGATAGGATLNDVSVTDNSVSTATPGIDVASGAVLHLEGGATISGTVGATMTLAGTLEVDNGSDSINNVTVTDVGTNAAPARLVVSGGTLTLNNDSFSGGVIEITVDSGASLVLSDTNIDNAILVTEPGGNLTVPGNSAIETINSTLSGNNAVGSGVTLTLTDESVTGTIKNHGILDIETAGAFPNGAIFDGVIVTDIGTSPNGGIEVGKTSTATLTLKDGAAISGGYLNVESGSQLSITTASGATLDNVIVDDDTTTFSPPGIDVASGSVLTLDDGTQIWGGGNGTLTIETGGQLSITTASGATLDGLLVHDDNTADGIDVASGAALTLNDGAQIVGTGTGKMTVEHGGRLVVAAGSGQDLAKSGGATLDGMNVDNLGAAQVNSGSTLTLTGSAVSGAGSITVDTGALLTASSTTISAGSVTNKGELDLTGSDTITGGSLDNANTLDVSGTGNAITSEASFTNSAKIEVLAFGQLMLSGETVSNSGGSITVDAATEHTAAGLLSLSGTTVNSGMIDNKGELDLTGSDAITGGSLDNANTLDVSGTDNAIGSETSFTNSDKIEVLANGQLTLSGETVNNSGGSITVDTGALLTASSTTISAGSVTNKGALDLTGSDTITGGSLDNANTLDISGTDNAIASETSFTNSAKIEMLANGQLTLTGETVNNSGGSITVDTGALLTASSTTISAGSVTNKGELDLTGSDTITGGSLDNANTLDISGTDNAIASETSFTNSAKIEVLANGQLTLTGETVSNSGGSITVDIGALLTASSTTISAGSVTNKGELDLTGSDTITGGSLDNANTLDVSGTGNAITSEASFTNSAKIEVLAFGQLMLSGETVSNTSGSITVDAATEHTAAGLLSLSGTTVNSGMIDNKGELDLTGSDTITGGSLDNANTLDVSGTDNAIGSEASFTNSDKIEVLANGQLTLSGETVSNSGGAIEATGSGSTVELNNVTIAGGTLSTGHLADANSGLIAVEAAGGANTSVLDGSVSTVTVAGYVRVETGANLELKGTIDNTGTIDVDTGLQPATTTALEISGTVTLNGAGTVTLDGASDQIVAAASGAVLDNANTISGDGQIGAGDTNLTLDNVSGTIDASTGTLTIETGSNTITNTGTLEATNGATLKLDSAVDNSGGRVQALNGEIDVTYTGGDDIITASGGTVVITDDSLGNIPGSAFGSGATVSATGGTLTVENRSSFGSGPSLSTGGSGAILTVNDSSFGNDANVHATGGSSLDVASSTFGDGVTIDASGGSSLTIDGGASFAAGDSVTLSSGTVTIDGTSIDGYGTLSGALGSDVASVTADGGTLDITGLTTGTVAATVDSGDALTVGAATDTVTFGSLDNSGTLNVAAGTLDVTGAVTGGGTTQIDANATFEIGSTNAETVNFNGGGTGGTFVIDNAALTDTSHYTGTIGDGGAGDFVSGDTIDLKDVTYALGTETDVWVQGTGTHSGSGTLTIYSGTTAEATLNLAGSYNQNDFMLQGDSGIGTQVVWNPSATTSQSASFSAGSIAFENGHWVVNDGIVTMSGVDQVTIGSGPAAKTYLLVDNAGAGGYGTIQAAVNAAQGSGDTILIAPGTYHEQVSVTNGAASGLTIEGANGAGTVTVDAPTTLQETAISPTSQNPIDGIFTVDGVNNVAITGLNVNGLDYGDGAHFAPSQPGTGSEGPSLIGIAYVNAGGGVISGDTITGTDEAPANIGDQRNFGIFVVNNNTLAHDVPTSGEAANLNTITISDSSLSGFQKGGIVVEYANATISGNTLTGAGDVNTAQNAIEIRESTGTVANNIISAIGYSGSSAAATGVLAFDNYGLDIAGNQFTGALDSGGHLLLSPVGVYVLDSTNGAITGNAATNVDDGVVVLSNGFGAGNDILGSWTVSGNTTTNVVPAADGGDSIYFDPAPTTSASSFVATGGATDVGDVFYVTPGADTLTGGGGGGNSFVVLSGSDLSAADTIHGGGSSGNTVYFASTTPNDTLTIGSNVTNIQDVNVVDPNTFASTDTTPETVDASAASNALTITANNGGDTITGTATHNDTLIGGAGNDTFIVGAGNDTVTGGAGTDTVVYPAGTGLNAGDFTYNSVPGTWTVTTGAGSTDTLGGVEKVTDGTHTFFLVDPSGSYTSIQAAINAASAGDTVVVGNGTYTENVTLKDGVNVVGQSEAGVVINGTLATPAHFDNATVSNLTVNDGSSTAMLLDMTATQEVTSSTFDHVTFNLTADSTLPVLIGNGQVAGSIELQDSGLTFSNDVMNSGDHVAGSTAFAYTLFHSVSGAQLLIDNVTLEGTASGTNSGLGAQWNMSPNTGETAYVTIEDSHTSGGGNYYVSGMTGATVTDNTFDGQGLALNGVAEASVTGNTFENVDGTYTANGTQDRGLTVENAWGAPGDSNITVTGNAFTNDTAGDGAIALQRWTDSNGNLTPATITTLSDVTVDGNTFTNVTTPIFLNASSFGANSVVPSVFGDSQLVIGTAGNDSIIAPATGSTAIYGGGGVDTVTFGSGYHVAISGGNWVVTNGAVTDTLSGIDKVNIAGTTYDLVDKFGAAGGFQSLQAAIDAAGSGDKILVAPGTYTESANYNPNTGLNDPNFTNPLGLLVDKSVTIEGVDSSGGLITSASTSNPTIVSSIESDWGTNFYITAPNVTITGLNFQGTSVEYGQGTQSAINKDIEIVANNVTLANDYVGAASGVVVGSSVYVDELTVPSNLSNYVADISSYDITHNVLTGDFAEASGVGYGDATTNLQLTDNTFTLNAGTTLANYVTGDGGYSNDVVILNGNLTGIGVNWDLAPVVAPEVSGNTVDSSYTSAASGGALFLVWDSSASPYLPDAAYVADYIANNITNNPNGEQEYAYALKADGSLDYSTQSGTSYFFIYVGTGEAAAAGAANPGDTIVVESNGDTSVQTIATDNLTIDALAGSNGLNLLLGSGVHTITLADYTWGEGANITVTGNGEGDTIIANDGNDVLNPGDASGPSTLTGGAGNDTFVYGAGYGAVTITNFDQGSGSFVQGKDIIDLTNETGVGNITQLQNDAVLSSGNTVITFASGDTLTLDHVTPSQLTAADFTFASPPSVSANSTSASTTEGVPLTLSGLSVSDGYASHTLTVTLGVADGTLALVNSSGLAGDTGTGTALSPLTLTGTVAEIDAALSNGVTYTPNSAFAGTDTLSFSASDGVIASNTATVNIGVADAPLTAGTVAASGGVVGTTATTLSATFTDANVAAPTGNFSGTVNWGDGNTTPFTNAAVSGSNGAFTVSGLSHLYAEDGNYNVSVTINDVGGSSATDSGTATVSAASPTLDTTPSSTAVTLATSPVTLTDSAVLAGGYNETGNVTFTLVGPGSTIVDTETVTVSGNGTYTTPNGYTLPTGGTVTGTYQWDATYNGDANNNTISDNNSSTEQVIVTPASPTLDTTPSSTAVTLATSPVTLTDSAVLAGGYHDTGTITFTLVGPGSTTVDTETVSVTGNGTYATPTGYTLSSGGTAGTYQWNATYNGDANNNTVSDVGNSNEQVTVLPASGPTLTIADHTLTVGQGDGVPLGISESPATSGDPVTVTISGIPTDATLSDSNGDTLAVAGGSITLTQPELAGLTLNAGATSATLTVVANEMSGQAGTGSPVTVNFDALNTPDPNGASGTPVANFLAGYGITLTTSNNGPEVFIANQDQIYGGGIVEATTGYNLVSEGGGANSPANPVSYTLTFATPLTSFAFDQVVENSGPTGSSYAAWSATAYNAADQVVDSVGDPNITYVFSGSDPGVTYALSGSSDITSVTFSGNDFGFAGFANIVTDNWVLTPESTLTSASQTIDVTVTPPGPTVDTWNGAGDWVNDASTDWSTGSAPKPGDQATIASGQAQINFDLTLDGNAVQNNAEIDIGVASGSVLTLDDGTTISGGALVIGDGFGGTLDVEHGSGGGPNYGATFDGVAITDNGALDLGDVTSGAVLTLDDGTTITGGGTGTLTIGSGDTLQIENGTSGPNYGATLDGVQVSNSGTIQVGVQGPPATVDLVLTDGSVVSGGTISIGASGEVEIGSSGNGATFDGVTVTDMGKITVDDSATLTFASSTSANTITSGTGASATIINGGIIAISTGLSLSGVTIEGGTIVNSGSISVTFDSTIDNGAQVTGGEITLDPAKTLTLGSGATDTVTFDGVSINDNGTITIASGTKLTISGTGGSANVVDGGGDSIRGLVANHGVIDIAANATFQDSLVVSGGQITIESGVTLTLDGTQGGGGVSVGSDITDNTGTIQVNRNVTYSGTLTNSSASSTVQVSGTMTLSGATIEGGTISNNGTIDVTGLSKIDDATVGGIVAVETGATLTLDGVTYSGGAITVDSGATLAIGDTVTLQGGGTVTMASGSHIAEPLTDTGSVVTLDNVDNTIQGAGTIGNHDALLALTNAGTIDANISGAALTIDTADNTGNSSTLINTGTLEASNGGELSVHSTVDDAGGTVSASGGFVDFLLGISGGGATVAGGGKLEYGWSSNVDTAFNGAGTLVLDHQNQSDPNFANAAYTGTISNYAAGDTIDVTDLTYNSTTPADNTVTWTQGSGGGTLTISDGTDSATVALAGTYSQGNFALAPDGTGGNAGTDVLFEQSPSLWGTVANPTNPTSGEHLYGVFATSPNGPSNGDLVAAVYAATLSSYSNAGPDSLNTYLLTTDPFLLPYSSSIVDGEATGRQVGSSNTIPAGDFPHNSRQLQLASISSTSSEGLGFVVTEDGGGNAAISQFYFTEPTTELNSSFSPSTPVSVESGLIGADLQYYTSIETNSSSLFVGGTGSGAAYSVAWGQYNGTSQTLDGIASDDYVVKFQIFSPADATSSTPDNTADSSVITPITDTGVTSFTDALAWYFRSAGSAVVGGSGKAIFGLVDAQLVGGTDVIKFQAYNESGGTAISGTNLPSFTITPDLDYYTNNLHLTGVTDSIAVEVGSGNHTDSPNALQFIPISVSGSFDYAVAWNDAVSAGGNTYDQVEFGIYTQAGASVGTHATFQIADGNVQDVELTSTTISGAAVILLIYGDDTGTNVVEFNTSGTEIGSFFNPATSVFDHTTVFGDGRIGLTYDVPDLTVDPSGATTHYVTDIYDLRTLGLNVGSATGTSDQYFAGTQYGDTIVGANNVNNTYDFVGDNTSSSGPSYSFTGGTGTTVDGNASWNVVILPGTPSDYSSVGVTAGAGGGSGTIVSADPTHAGTIDVTDIQALAFSPTADPSGNAGSLYASGGGLFVYGPLPSGEQMFIEDNSTLQLFAADNSTTSTVTFQGDHGYFVDTDPSAFAGVVGTASGTFAPGDVIDLQGLNAHSGDLFVVGTTPDGSDTILTVTDGGSSASITVAGIYQSSNWTPSFDGVSGVDIVDPPAPSPSVLTSAASTSTTDTVTGSLSFADSDPASAISASATADGANYHGSFTLDQPTESNGQASVNFDFMANNDQMNLAPGQTLTQSYNVTVADAQNPAENTAQTVSVTVGGPGNDHFVFAPGLGADTVVNFNAQQDTLEFDHFANVQTAQELQALISTDAHGDAVINLGHNDSVTLSGVTDAQLQQVIHAGHLLLH